MLPLKDTIRSHSFPIVNWLLIGATTLVFLFEASLPSTALNRLIAVLGIVPARLHLNNPLSLVTDQPAALDHPAYPHILTWRLVSFPFEYVDFIHLW